MKYFISCIIYLILCSHLTFSSKLKNKQLFEAVEKSIKSSLPFSEKFSKFNLPINTEQTKINVENAKSKPNIYDHF